MVPDDTIFSEDSDNILIIYNEIVVERHIIYCQRDGATSNEVIGNDARFAPHRWKTS